MKDRNIILSLFDYSGQWSAPFKNAGYEVFQIDSKLGINILNWDYKTINKENVYGILAAPPCTQFTKASSNRWFNFDVNGDTARSLILIQTTLNIIKYFNPFFWALENPPGRLTKIYPPIAPFKLFRFYPWQFGDPIHKQTEIYGNFNPFLIQKPVKPIYTVAGKRSKPSIMDFYKLKYPKYNRASLRSITPTGFANAFYNANRNLSFEKSLS